MTILKLRRKSKQCESLLKLTFTVHNSFTVRDCSPIALWISKFQSKRFPKKFQSGIHHFDKENLERIKSNQRNLEWNGTHLHDPHGDHRTLPIQSMNRSSLPAVGFVKLNGLPCSSAIPQSSSKQCTESQKGPVKYEGLDHQELRDKRRHWIDKYGREPFFLQLNKFKFSPRNNNYHSPIRMYIETDFPCNFIASRSLQLIHRIL